MPVKIAVLKETRPHERRVAMVPAVADKLAKLGVQIHMQSGAGVAVKLADTAYKNVTLHDDPIEMVRDADIVLSVQPPELPVVQAMREGAILISFVYAHKEPDLTRAAARSEDHLLRDGAGSAHHARAGDGRAVEPGGAGRVLRSVAGCNEHRAHAADDDYCSRLDPPGARAGDGTRRRGSAGARDCAPSRRDDRRLRRAARHERASRIARREVRRHRSRRAR